MSYTEFHKGKLKVIAKGDEAIIKYAKDNNIIKDLNLEIEGNKIKNHDSYDYKDYDILTLHRYKPNQILVLIKYIKHKYWDFDEEYINEFEDIGNNEYDFTMLFYNGGTCESEILEENLEKII